MTIPVVVMIASGLLWFFWEVVMQEAPDSPMSRFRMWFIGLCRIVFAAATLVTLWSVMSQSLS